MKEDPLAQPEKNALAAGKKTNKIQLLRVYGRWWGWECTDARSRSAPPEFAVTTANSGDEPQTFSRMGDGLSSNTPLIFVRAFFSSCLTRSRLMP